MRINLKRLEELKTELQVGDGDDGYSEGLHIIIDSLRLYIFDGENRNPIIIKLLMDYRILESEDEKKPTVSPHNFEG